MITKNDQFTLSPKHFQTFLYCITTHHSENFLECFSSGHADAIKTIEDLDNWAKEQLLEDEVDMEEEIIKPLLKKYQLKGKLKHVKAYTYYSVSNGESHGMSLSRCLFNKNPAVFAAAETILDIIDKTIKDGWDN